MTDTTAAAAPQSPAPTAENVVTLDNVVAGYLPGVNILNGANLVARKGERLVLFTERKDATRAAYQSFAKGKGVPEIAIPAEVVVLERVPMLGTGKVDQVSVVKLAHERAAGQAPAADIFR